VVLLRYITCLVAAFAVISYTVHLERNTPVVLKVKTLLGLDTTNLEIARSAKGGPGFIESALSIVETVQNLPKAGDLLSDGLERKQSKILPEPLRGWHKEDRPFDAIALLDFEDGFYPGRTKRSDTLKDSASKDVLTWRGEHFVVTRDRKSGLAKAGVRIESSPRLCPVAKRQLFEKSQLLLRSQMFPRKKLFLRKKRSRKLRWQRTV